MHFGLDVVSAVLAVPSSPVGLTDALGYQLDSKAGKVTRFPVSGILRG